MSGPAQVFELEISVELADIDQLGHVNNVAYVRWVQDAAVAHWTGLAPFEDQQKLVWVVLRHEIDYKQAAHFGDDVIARTWVGSASWVRFERFTEMLRAKDRAVLAKARTLWCALDATTGKPTAVSPAVRELFSVEGPPAKDWLGPEVHYGRS
jgi:acyl-CoA thioester hydrolase